MSHCVSACSSHSFFSSYPIFLSHLVNKENKHCAGVRERKKSHVAVGLDRVAFAQMAKQQVGQNHLISKPSIESVFFSSCNLYIKYYKSNTLVKRSCFSPVIN